MRVAVIIFFIMITCACGCIQNQTSPGSEKGFSDAVPATMIPVSETITPIPTESTNQTENISPALLENITRPAPVVSPSQSPVVSQHETPFAPPVPDKNVAFRDMVLPMIDLMQNAKAGVLLSGEAGDPGAIENKTRELSVMIRNNAGLKDVPRKMDYVLVNYHEYIDQMTQFTSSYASAAERLKAGDPASSRSYQDAGKIASDRADIAVKRITVFFEEHLT
jgi:hypothetical protein